MAQAILTASKLMHLDALVDWFNDITRKMAERQAARITYNELQKLTDKELWDIGISRGEIYSIAYDLEGKK